MHESGGAANVLKAKQVRRKADAMKMMKMVKFNMLALKMLTHIHGAEY